MYLPRMAIHTSTGEASRVYSMTRKKKVQRSEETPNFKYLKDVDQTLFASNVVNPNVTDVL